MVMQLLLCAWSSAGARSSSSLFACVLILQNFAAVL
jgi:hypothetical protein